MNGMKCLSLITLLLSALLFSCAGEKPPVEEPAPVVEPIEAAAPVVEEPAPSGPTAEELRAAELERQRAELEAMINRIMSEDIYFEYDKAILTAQARDLLADVGDILLKQKKFEVIVEGHTDARGTESYNLTLGSNRAQKVQEYLYSYGVEQARIRTVSFGEEKPKSLGESEEAYSKNRRARFQVKIKE